jgi:hypothetical protein
MAELIPPAIAKQLIEAGLRDRASMAQHIVVHEALALLIGHLHRAGAVHADQLAADLTRAFSAPQAEQLAPGIGAQAATLAARIRGAANPAAAPGAGRPENS